MPESIYHKQLKQQAKQILLSEGFREEKILIDKFRFPVEEGSKRFFRCDAYASNGKVKVIECGDWPWWKHDLYYKKFGRENVMYLPYPKGSGRYNRIDVAENNLNPAQARQFLIDTYKKYVFEEFKDDSVFNFLEFNEETRVSFDIDNHQLSYEFNPDYGKEDKIIHSRVWMNFPSSAFQTKTDFMKKIHMGMIYYNSDVFSITITLSGKESCSKFLDLSDENHDKIFDALKQLPADFKIRSGFLDRNSRPSPPFDKHWNTPLQCHELQREDYDEIINDLEILTYEDISGFGPCLDLAKVYVHEKEIPGALRSFRDLYSLLIKAESKLEAIINKIKQSPKWEVFITPAEDFEILAKRFNLTDKVEIRKIRSILKKDPIYVKYENEYLRR